jgi:hypothetical protein
MLEAEREEELHDDEPLNVQTETIRLRIAKIAS